MAAFMYTVFSIAMHCNLDKDISPCVCAPHEIKPRTLVLTCEEVGSFNQVVDSLQNKINRDVDIWLKITYSQLQDLDQRQFDDLNMNIKNLRLNYNQLRYVPESTFRNMSKLEFLSLSDNDLEEVPRHILDHTPRIGTLDLGQGWIRKVYADDFMMLNHIRHLVLVNNRIITLERNSIPKTIRYLHLGRNNITSLNGTIRELDQMEVLFINDNEIGTLNNELPAGSEKLMMLIAHHNRLKSLPRTLETMPHLDSLYFSYNQLTSLDGIFKHGTFIHNLFLDANRIDYLAKDEFQYCERMEILDLSHNFLQSLNRSLLSLDNLRSANFSHNLLEEFSLSEIRGLKLLRIIDLSYNRIEKLTGRMENIVEPDSFILEIRLDHNLLKSLDGAMMGFNKLRVLNLAHNLLKFISPDDLIGLEELEALDVSHNYLQSLEETEKTFLPNLEKLDASYNNISKLNRDFHGLPNLCMADLSNNRITSISSDLVSKSRCIRHGVLSKLELYLQENPILCHDNLSDLVTTMEAQETRLIGVAHCIVPKEEIAEAASAALFIAPSMPILPALLNTQVPLPNLPTTVVKQSPSIVQVILPATIILQPPSVDAQSIPSTKSTLVEMLSSSTISPSSATGSIVSTAAITPVSVASSPTITTTSTTTTTTTTKATSTGQSITSTLSPGTKAPGTDTISTNNGVGANLDADNSVYEQMAQIPQGPQVLIANSDRGQHFVEPEEPPEMLQDQNVSGGI